MGTIIVLVFLGVFAVVALVMVATSGGASQQAKQVHATLDSALATDRIDGGEQIINFRKTDRLSAIPWLNKRLLQFELAPRIQTLLIQADVKMSAGVLLTSCALLFAGPAYLAYLRTNNILGALGVGLLCGFIPLGWLFHKRTKRMDVFQQGLPEAMDLMVSALRAGHSLVAAIGSVARECAPPVGSEFKNCFEEQNYGLELKTAMDNMIKRIPLQDLRIFATAVMIQKESGGNLAEVLDKTAYVIRERFRLKRQVGVHTAQGRMTGWVLTLLPVALGTALYFVNPTMMQILWTNPTGIKMLWAAFGGIVIGGLIIRHIVNMDV